MSSKGDEGSRATTQAFLVDPGALSVEWMNEAGRGRPGPRTRRRGPSDPGTWGGGRPDGGQRRRD